MLGTVPWGHSREQTSYNMMSECESSSRLGRKIKRERRECGMGGAVLYRVIRDSLAEKVTFE